MSDPQPLFIEDIVERVNLRTMTRTPTIVVSNGKRSVEVPVSSAAVEAIVSLLEGDLYNPEGGDTTGRDERRGTTIPGVVRNIEDDAGDGWLDIEDDDMDQGGPEEDDNG